MNKYTPTIKDTFKMSVNLLSKKIPEALTTAVSQLQEYFKGNRTHFNLKLNPQGTDFQKRVFQKKIKKINDFFRFFIEKSKKRTIFDDFSSKSQKKINFFRRSDFSKKNQKLQQKKSALRAEFQKKNAETFFCC